jgi:hypothetical protein
MFQKFSEKPILVNNQIFFHTTLCLKKNSKPRTFKDMIRLEQSKEHNRTDFKMPFLRRQRMLNKTEDIGL